MERKYQLVAWTRNVADLENARLCMVPSLEFEMQAPFISELCECHQEEIRKHGHITPDLAKRTVTAYEKSARFEFLTGHYGDGLRFLCRAALYCVWSDEFNWTYYDNDLGTYSFFCGELRHEFMRLCEEVISLANKYSRHDVLLEKGPEQVMDIYQEQIQEDVDLKRHLKVMSAWK